MTKIDIKKLAELSRLEMSNDEMTGLENDISNILDYITQIQEITSESNGGGPEIGHVHNVLREDENPHETGVYSESLMREVPNTVDKDGGVYVSVKKIL